MQALEKIGVLEKDEEKGGRRITQSGQRDLGKSRSLFPHLFRWAGPGLPQLARPNVPEMGSKLSSRMAFVYDIANSL